MRRSQPRANGQWLQVKTTSVPALPVTSAIETDLPSSALFIFVAAAGAGAPIASGPADARVLARIRTAKLMDDLSSWGGGRPWWRGRSAPGPLRGPARLPDRARTAAPRPGCHRE